MSGGPVVDPAAPAGMVVRLATSDDAATLARHRSEMFRAMGRLDDSQYEVLVRQAAGYFRRAIPSGAYVGWVMTAAGGPTTVVAGAGVQVRPILPRPDRTGTRVLSGRQGLVVNVFTEEKWRRRGAAEYLMRVVLAWARAERLASLVLHASNEGRSLYEKLGFASTNEMQYRGSLQE